MQVNRQVLPIRASSLPLCPRKTRPRQPWRSRFRSRFRSPSQLQSQRWLLRQRSLPVAPRPPQQRLRDVPRRHRHRLATPLPRRISGTDSPLVKPAETGQRTPATDTGVGFSSPTTPTGRHGVPLAARNSPLTHGKRHESSRSSSPSVFSPDPVGARGPGARPTNPDESFLVCFRFNESLHLRALFACERCRGRFAVIA